MYNKVSVMLGYILYNYILQIYGKFIKNKASFISFMLIISENTFEKQKQALGLLKHRSQLFKAGLRLNAQFKLNPNPQFCT